MDLFASLHRRTHDLIGRLSAAGLLAPDTEAARSSVSPSAAGSRHDLVLDAALIHARDAAAASAGPAWLAQTLAAEVSGWPEVETVETSEPGFVEVTLRPAARGGVVREILGRAPPGGAAGPRRPPWRDGATLAEARAAVLADVVSRLAAASGSAEAAAADGIAAPPCGSVMVACRRDPREAGGGSERRADIAAVVAAVGADAFRIAALSRRPGATLRLDLGALRERARANAAFWLPYVHARSRTLLRRSALAVPQPGLDPSGLARADLGALTRAEDLALLRLLMVHRHTMSRAASARLPHLFHAQLCALADGVHGQWSGSKDQPQLRFVNEQRRYSTEARLALVTASTLVLGSGLGILGVATPDEMP